MSSDLRFNRERIEALSQLVALHSPLASSTSFQFPISAIKPWLGFLEVIVSSWLIKTRRQDQSHCFSGTITPLANQLTLLFQGFKRPIQKFTREKMHQTQ